MKVLNFSILSLVILFMACSVAQTRSAITFNDVRALQMGTPKDQVLAKFGSPDRTANDSQELVLDYMEKQKSIPRMTLVFDAKTMLLTQKMWIRAIDEKISLESIKKLFPNSTFITKVSFGNTPDVVEKEVAYIDNSSHLQINYLPYRNTVETVSWYSPEIRILTNTQNVK